ncbi:MAG: hypothetical protein ACYCZP_14005 [Acidimicrobiales bacterium]
MPALVADGHTVTAHARSGTAVDRLHDAGVSVASVDTTDPAPCGRRCAARTW